MKQHGWQSGNTCIDALVLESTEFTAVGRGCDLHCRQVAGSLSVLACNVLASVEAVWRASGIIDWVIVELEASVL